jgi:hypothetical protein
VLDLESGARVDVGARQVATGQEACARCGELIEPWERFDLDHRDDRQGYLGVSHVQLQPGDVEAAA